MKKIILFCVVLFLAACSGEKTDQLLLELDKKKLAENINQTQLLQLAFLFIERRTSNHNFN